tara:strand:+ start:380 stop:697 length:318 start_codon:yes stop_codon:yes gene_type:complete
MAEAKQEEMEEKKEVLSLPDDKGVIVKHDVSTFSDGGKALFSELVIIESKLSLANGKYMDALVDLKIVSNAKEQYISKIKEVEKLNGSEKETTGDSKEKGSKKAT